MELGERRNTASTETAPAMTALPEGSDDEPGSRRSRDSNAHQADLGVTVWQLRWLYRLMVLVDAADGDDLVAMSADDEFTAFFPEAERRLRTALAASWGVEVGTEAAAEALAWGWQHWGRIRGMANPHGYLYRVGRTAARRLTRRPPPQPPRVGSDAPEFEPGLHHAIQTLSARQRAVVVLVVGIGWSQQETADVLGISASSVRTHLRRGQEALKRVIGDDGGDP